MNTLKKLWALLLCMCISFTLLPAAAFAAGPHDSVPLTLKVSSYSAPFIDGGTGQHTVYSYKAMKYISRTEACEPTGANASGSATARFTGSNATGWTLVIDVTVGKYTETWSTNARVTNKDMSDATGTIDFGMSWNSQGGTSTYISIGGSADIPTPAPNAPNESIVDDLLANSAVNIDCTNTHASHTDKTYNLIPGTYTIGTVQGSSSAGYTCAVTVNRPASYISQYNADSGCDHAPSPVNQGSKTITLQYKNNAWSVKNGTAPVTYTVICETPPEPQIPEKPDNPAVEDLLTNTAVNIDCINTDIFHEDKAYGLKEGYTIGNVYGNETDGYKVDVTVPSGDYVTQYNTETDTGHLLSPDSQREQAITLEYTPDGWKVGDGEVPLTYTVICVTPPEPQIPEKPDNPAVEDLLTNTAVNIDCINTDIFHEDKVYGLKDGYTVGNVYGNETDGYKVNVTVPSGDYVAQYNTETDTGHVLSPDSQGKQAITLEYTPDGWKVGDGEVPLTYTVICVTPPEPDIPDMPDKSTVEEFLNNNAVKIDCINTGVFHEDKIYGLKEGFLIGEIYGNETDGYKVDVTVPSVDYVTQYNTEMRVDHVLSPATQGEQHITLEYVDGVWKVAKGDFPVTYTVTYETPPAPEKPDGPDGPAVEALLANKAVKIDCINTGKSHADKLYGLKEGYTIGKVYGNETDGYKTDITVAPGIYVKQYNTDMRVSHVLSPAEQGNQTITLEYSSGNWKVGDREAPATYTVICKTSVNPTKPDTPKTGDNSNMTLWLGSAILAGTGVAASISLGRKKRRKNQ